MTIQLDPVTLSVMLNRFNSIATEMTVALSNAAFSGLPYFGPLGGDPRVLVGVGFSGSGVVPAVAGGRILASLALGLTDEWPEAAASLTAVRSCRLPPEPFRYIGGVVVQRSVMAKERSEGDGRRPPPVTSLLARLVPGGVIERR